MKFSHVILATTVMAGTTALSSVSLAQNSNVSNGAPVTDLHLGVGTPPSALPPSRSDNDPLPRVAAPVVPAGGVVQQAGVGGSTAYGRPGVLEFGGSLGMSFATGRTQLSVAPSIGWFFTDNLQLSAIASVSYARVSDAATNTSANTTTVTLLAEPSYHLPLSSTLFAFLGVGVGMAYSSARHRDGTALGAGFALAPRLGLNIMVGRSGILTPAFQLLYQTTDLSNASNGDTLVGVNTALGFNAGYTVMW